MEDEQPANGQSNLASSAFGESDQLGPNTPPIGAHAESVDASSRSDTDAKNSESDGVAVLQVKTRLEKRPTNVLEFLEFAFDDRGRRLNFKRKDFEGIALIPANVDAEKQFAQVLSASKYRFHAEHND